MAEPLKPLAEAIGASPARERLIAAHEALGRARDSASRTRAEQEVAAAIEGVLVEVAEKIAEEVSERVEEINGLLALIGVSSGFVASLKSTKSMRLRGLIATNDTTDLSRPETLWGETRVAADGCWKAFADSLVIDPRAGLLTR